MTSFFVRLILVLSMVSYSSMAIDSDNSSDLDLTQQKDELLGSLTSLVGKKEKVVDKAGDVQVKIADLKDAVKLLENKTERTKVIKALSALALLKQEADKKQGVVEAISAKISNGIEITSEATINSLKLLTRIPGIVSTQIDYLQQDEGYRSNSYILLMIMLTSVLAALIAEFMVRQLFIWTKSNDELEFIFKKLHFHIVRNTAPVIIFGLVGYITIHFSQDDSNLITYRGYMAMNFIMMLRTMWLIIKALFITRPKNPNQVSSAGFQFTLAGLQTIIIGILFAELGYYMGMGEIAVDTWLKIIGFGIMSLIVIAIYRHKDMIRSQFSPNDEHLSGVALLTAKFTEIIFKKSPFILSFGAIISFVLWLGDMNLIAKFIATGLVKTTLLATLFIIGRNRIFRWIFETRENLSLENSTQRKLGLNYLEGSSTNIIQLVWHLGFLLTLSEIWGADPFEIATSPDVQPYISKAMSIAIILVIIRTLWGWSDHIAKSHIRGRLVGKKIVESSQFAKTVTPILNSVAHWVLSIMAIILILVEFGQDVRPMLYSLGVIGIAISLGAQSLVKDIINGVLTLMEGNIAVGEVVTIGANTGTVESLSLRSVVLRHATGAIQTIPFSEVTSIINKSRDYSFYSINFAVPHRTDPTRAVDLLNHTYEDVKKDPEFGKMILDQMVITGIDQISDTGIVISGFIKIKPDPRNRFGRTFNKYLQQRMEEADIYPPASQMYLNVTG